MLRLKAGGCGYRIIVSLEIGHYSKIVFIKVEVGDGSPGLEARVRSFYDMD
jgi:hypothetical protein